jgi:hypothetical protein
MERPVQCKKTARGCSSSPQRHRLKRDEMCTQNFVRPDSTLAVNFSSNPKDKKTKQNKTNKQKRKF